MVAFNGWANVAMLAGEVKDAEQTVPWALLWGILGVIGLRTPAVSILTVAFIGAFLAVVGSYDRLSSMATFGNIPFFTLNAWGLIWWPGGKETSIRHGIRRYIPWIFLLGSVWLLVNAMIRRGYKALVVGFDWSLLQWGISNAISGITPTVNCLARRRSKRCLSPAAQIY
jgi:hypothetical protein